MKKQKNQDILNWFILFLLGFVWGSSFILMKIGAKVLDGFQIAAIRNSVAGLSVLPIFIYYFRKYSKKTLLFFVVCALLGNGIPSILYGFSAKLIDSNINGVINSLTPIFTLLFGIIIWKYQVSKWSILGTFVGFVGVFMLFFNKEFHLDKYWHIFLPLVSTVMYGANTNLVKKYLSHLPSIQMLAGVFGVMSIPALVYLIFSNTLAQIDFQYFNLHFWEYSNNPTIQFHNAFLSIFLLGFMNSLLSSLLFYYFLKRTTVIFAAMTTYLIPITSIFWGYVDHEAIGWLHLLSLATILSGVALVGRKK